MCLAGTNRDGRIRIGWVAPGILEKSMEAGK